MILSSFTPNSSTYLLAADTVAPTPIQPVASSGLGSTQFHIANVGTQTAYLSWGNTAALATAGAVIPTAGNPQKVLPVMSGNAAIYSLPAGSFVTALTSGAGPNNLLVTLGEGL